MYSEPLALNCCHQPSCLYRRWTFIVLLYHQSTNHQNTDFLYEGKFTWFITYWFLKQIIVTEVMISLTTASNHHNICTVQLFTINVFPFTASQNKTAVSITFPYCKLESWNWNWSQLFQIKICLKRYNNRDSPNFASEIIIWLLLFQIINI